MKILMLVCLAASLLLTSKEALAEERKILIAYFSWSGNTRSIAQQIQRQVGGDLVEIEALRPYSKDYNTCLDEARRDQENQARPEIRPIVKNMGQYELVFLGYPNWWASIPMPVATFLEQYDWKGKTIIPFVSHGGGRLGRSVDDIAKLGPEAKILEALSVSYGGGGSLPGDIEAWLDKIGLGK